MKIYWVSFVEIMKSPIFSIDSINAEMHTKGLLEDRIGCLWKFKTNEVDKWLRRGVAAPISNEQF